MYCGIKPYEFWEYSLDEIKDLIEVYKKHQEEKTKETIMYNYSLANFIRIFIGSILSKDVEIPNIYELYPDIFKDELEKNRKERIEQELLLHKERMREYAVRMNELRKSKEKI